MSYQQFGHVDREERIDLATDEPFGEPVRRSLLPRPILTVLVMAGFAGALYFAYVQGTHHAPPAAPAASTTQTATAARTPATPAIVPQTQAPADNIPLIRADPQPLKVKPEQPGGMVVPDRDKLIYTERPGGPPVEKLLPPPEQPAPRPLPPPPAAAAPLPLAAPPQIAMIPQPVPPAATKPAPVSRGAAPPPAIGADKGGHIRIQIASLRTPDEARDEWQRLKRANPDLLGKMSADAVRADLGDRGIWYRIEAGSFGQAAAAERVCRELKARHLGCSVVK